MSLTGVRARRLAVLLGLAGSGLALLAQGRVWASARLEVAVLGGAQLTVTGREAAPGLVALALVSAAGAIAAATAGRRARPVIGVLLALAGLGVAGLAMAALIGPQGALRVAAGEATGTAGAGPGLVGVAVSAWPAVTVAAGVLVLSGAALTLGTGSRWPGPAPRYEAPAGRGAPPGDAWDALSRGDDPTADRRPPT